MKELLFFILGIVFVELIIPFLESLAVLIVAAIEAAKSKSSLKVAQTNAKIHKIADDLEEKPTANPIGFMYTPSEEDEDYDDEEEEDV